MNFSTTGRHLQHTIKELSVAECKLKKFKPGQSGYSQQIKKIADADSRYVSANDAHWKFLCAIISERFGSMVYADFNGNCMDCVCKRPCDRENSFNHDPDATTSIQILEPIVTTKISLATISAFEEKSRNQPKLIVIQSIQSNVESNVESRVDSRIESNVESNVESRVESNRESSIQSNVDSRVESNREASIQSNVESNVLPNVDSRVESNVESSILSSVAKSENVKFIPCNTCDRQRDSRFPQCMDCNQRKLKSRVSCACGLLREAQLPHCKNCHDKRVAKCYNWIFHNMGLLQYRYMQSYSHISYNQFVFEEYGRWVAFSRVM